MGRIAPRPVLFVGATRDQTIPRAATEALFAAAGEPKQLLWFDATHDALPGAALKAMWRSCAGRSASRAARVRARPPGERRGSSYTPGRDEIPEAVAGSRRPQGTLRTR